MSLTWEFVPVRGNEKEIKAELRVQILHTPTRNLLIIRHNHHHPSWGRRTVCAAGVASLLRRSGDGKAGYIGQTFPQRECGTGRGSDGFTSIECLAAPLHLVVHGPQHLVHRSSVAADPPLEAMFDPAPRLILIAFFV